MPPQLSPADAAPVRCPACGVPLRLKETRFLGATFACPECHEPLVLTRSDADGVEVQRATVLQPTAPPSRPRREWRLPSLSPLVVAWSLATVVAAVLIGAVWRDHLAETRATRRAQKEPPPPAVDVAADAEPTLRDEPSPIAATVEPDPPQEPVSAATVLAKVAPAAAPAALPAAPPPEPASVPASPIVAKRPDARVLLAQRLVSFQQSKPVARRELLAIIEDFLDRPVRLAQNVPAEIAARLDRPLTLSLENVTVEELLRAILGDTGFEFDCTDDAVTLRVR